VVHPDAPDLGPAAAAQCVVHQQVDIPARQNAQAEAEQNPAQRIAHPPRSGEEPIEGRVMTCPPGGAYELDGPADVVPPRAQHPRRRQRHEVRVRRSREQTAELDEDIPNGGPWVAVQRWLSPRRCWRHRRSVERAFSLFGHGSRKKSARRGHPWSTPPKMAKRQPRAASSRGRRRCDLPKKSDQKSPGLLDAGQGPAARGVVG